VRGGTTVSFADSLVYGNGTGGAFTSTLTKK